MRVPILTIRTRVTSLLVTLLINMFTSNTALACLLPDRSYIGAMSPVSHADARKAAKENAHEKCSDKGGAVFFDKDEKKNMQSVTLNGGLHNVLVCHCCRDNYGCGGQEEESAFELQIEESLKKTFELRLISRTHMSHKGITSRDQRRMKHAVSKECAEGVEYEYEFINRVKVHWSDLVRITCAGAVDAQWVFMGYRVANYIGPPKSYNKIPTEYGYYWLLRDGKYSEVRNRIEKEIKAANGGAYVDYTYVSPSSSTLVGIYEIKEDIGTWEGPKIEVLKYKFYSGGTQDEVNAKATKDVEEFGYKSIKPVKWINVLEMQPKLAKTQSVHKGKI